MKDSELQFDRTCHVLYSKPCKRQIREKIALHYPEGECETVWERVQRQYVTFLRDWRTDLGGSKNFHNGKGGTYDCIALMSYYVVCPTAEFARQFGLLEVMPALCSPDYAAMELLRAPLRLYDLRRPGRVVSGVPRIPRRGGVSAQYALTVDRWSDWLVLPPAGVLFPRGKSTQKRAKTKVLESFSVDKWGFSRTWPKCSIGFRSAQRRYYI